MRLIESSVRYPVTVLVGVMLAVLFGVIALTRIPLQMAPTVDRPQIAVETLWEGASPREVEEEITDKLEEKLNSVEGLTEITSTSEDGKSTDMQWINGANLFQVRHLINDCPLGENEICSMHIGGGAHGLFCDGSVRFLGEQTDREILSGICTRAEGDIVTNF